MDNYKFSTIIRTRQEQSTKQQNINSVTTVDAIDTRTSVNVKSGKASASFATNVSLNVKSEKRSASFTTNIVS